MKKVLYKAISIFCSVLIAGSIFSFNPVSAYAEPLSSDATLQSISFTSINGSEVFATIDEASATITASVYGEDQSVFVTTNSPAASYNIIDSFMPDYLLLTPGDNVYTLEVTAQDGTVKDYTMTVTRLLSSDATMSYAWITPTNGGSSVGGTIDSTADTITATVYGQDHMISFQPYIMTSTYTLKQNEADVPSNGGVYDVSLDMGDNVYTVEVTSEDGSVTKVYTMTLTRDLSNSIDFSAELYDSLYNYEGVYNFYGNTYNAGNVYGTDHTLRIIPAQNASYVVKDQSNNTLTPGLGGVPLSLVDGNNTITIEVTSEDGLNSSTCNLDLTRLQSSDNTISSVWVFTSADYHTEFAAVDNSAFTVAAQTYGDSQTITILPAVSNTTWVLKKGMVEITHTSVNTADVTLDIGDNVFDLEMTAEDGSMQTYVMTITRVQSTNPKLQSLILSGNTTGVIVNGVINNGASTVTATVLSPDQYLNATTAERMVTVSIKDSLGAEIVNPVTLNQGLNTFTVQLTAENGATKTYDMSVTLSAPKVTFVTNGGSAVADIYADLNSTITAPADPVKTGYAFAGWYKNAGLTTPWNFATDTVKGNTTLYAKWTQTIALITFNSNGGSAVADINADINTTITAPADPTRARFVFAGWYKDIGLTSPWNFATDVVTADTTLYAKWTQTIALITFDSNKGSAVADVNADINTTITAPADPTRTGYAFAGWYKDIELTSPWNFATDVVTADTTLYAKWTPTVFFTVKFYSLGSVFSTVMSEYSALLNEPAPYWPGHVVEGWYKESGYINKWDFATNTVTANMNLYAKWIAETYEIMFDSMGGSDVPSIFVSGDQYISFPAPPTKPGFVFVGWYQADLTTPYYNNYYKPSSNMIMFAKWAVETHKVTFNSQPGSAVSPVITDVNTTIAEPSAPTRTGYTFGGWYKESGLTNAWNFATDTVTTDITLYAKWTVNNYTVTFESNSGSDVPSVQADYNTTIAEPAAPARTEHIFSGWYKEAGLINAWNFASDVVTGNTTLYAKWISNKYTVTFESSPGSPVSPVKVDYGTAFAEPSAPNRTGYTLGGWYKDAGLTTAWNFATDIVTADITLYAKWTINSYLVTFDSQMGSSVPGVYADYSTTISEPVPPTRTGYTFSGWYKDSGFTTAWNFGEDVVTGATTLYAKWNVNSYLVTFDSKMGSSVPGVHANYNTTISEPTPPTRTGYTFGGWYKDAGLTSRWTFATDVVTGNITLYAKWGAIGYTVTFNAGTGGTVNPQSKTVLYGDSYGELPVPARTNYYFFGWYTAANGGGNLIVSSNKVNITSGVTLYAKWVLASSLKPKTPSITASSVDFKSIKISWKAIANATGYEIYRKTSGKAYTKIATVNGALSYTDTGLIKGTTYYYQVRAYGVPFVTKVYSNYSSSKSAKPAWPATSISASSQSYNSIVLTWNAVAGATGYEVLRSNKSNGKYISVATGVKSLSYIDKGLTTGTRYYYRVRAYNDSGSVTDYGPYSSYKSAKPVPAVPTGLAAIKTASTNITLSWNAVQGATMYEVYRAASRTGAYTKITTTSESSFENTGLTAGKTYYYKVRVYTLSGGVKVYGSFSAIASLKV